MKITLSSSGLTVLSNWNSLTELWQNCGLSTINNSLTTHLFSSISYINKRICSTFLVHEDEDVISREFKQQLQMERLRWPEVSCYTALAENIKIVKQP